MWSVRPVLKPSGSGSLQPPVQCPTQAWLLGSIRRSQVADPTGQLRGCRDNSRTPPTNGSRIDQVQLATTGLLAIPPWSLHSNSTFFFPERHRLDRCATLWKKRKKKPTPPPTTPFIHDCSPPSKLLQHRDGCVRRPIASTAVVPLHRSLIAPIAVPIRRPA